MPHLGIRPCALLALTLLAGPLVGCDRPPETSEPSTAAPPGEPKAATGTADPLPDPESLLEPGIGGDRDPSSTCLSACVEARRMDAMDATAIEILCAEDCDECETACTEDGETATRCAERCADAMTPGPTEHLPDSP